MSKVRAIAQSYGVLIAFLLLFAIGLVWQFDFFSSPEAWRNLVNQNAAVGLMAVGMTIVIVVGGIDLSVGSLAALSGGIGVIATNATFSSGMPEGQAVGAGLLACVGVGALAGAFNGFFSTYGKVPAFIVTLAGLVGFRSLIQALADGGELRIDEDITLFREIGSGGIDLPYEVAPNTPLTITWAMIAFVVVSLLAGFLLSRTRYGRHAIAVGSNDRAARYSGIDVMKVRFGAFTMLGLCTGLAGIVLATRFNSISSGGTAQFTELDAIAAVVIGGTRITGGYGRIWTTFVGVLLLGLINNMLSALDVSTHWQGCVKGAIILLAVLIQRSDKT